MYKYASWIVDHRRIVVTVMLILTIVCGILMPFVGINYDMTKYLPDDSSMKIGIDLMAEDFPVPVSRDVVWLLLILHMKMMLLKE